MVENRNYALQLCQYIHFNPNKAGLVNDISNWKYSNYLEWIGKRNGTLFCRDILLYNDLTPDMYAEMMKEYDSQKNEKLIQKYLF
jgi:putative transposase